MATNPLNPTSTPGKETKEKKATLKPQSFLFINKDSDSEVLSRSSGQVAASINSHVQRWQGKKGGRGRIQPKSQGQQQTSNTDQASTFKDHVTRFRPKPRQRAAKADSKHEDVQPVRKHSDSSSSAATTSYQATTDSNDVVELIRSDFYQPHRDAIFTANFSGADCIDPFQSTYAHLPGVQPILQYYVAFTLVSTFQSDSTAGAHRKEPPHFPAIRAIVRGSLSQQMHMYALLAATAARMKRVSGVWFPREISPEFLLQKAIRHMREYFASCTGPLSAEDRQVILDIFYLCVCEWYEKSYDVARTHLGFVRNFWKSLRPSESMFDKYIHDMITYNDVFLAIETASPPLFELTWEPAALPSERLTEIEEETRNLSLSPSQSPLSATISSQTPLSASTLSPSSITPALNSPAAGFMAFTASSNHQLPVELIAIIGDLVPLILTAHHHARTFTPPASNETQWVSLKTQALLHKLLSLQTRHQTLAESIRLSLIILLSCMSTSAAWRAGKVDMVAQASRLKASLSLPPWQDARYPIVVDNIHYPGSASPTLSSAVVSIDDKILLWVLFTGAFAAQSAWQVEQWFLMQAVQVVRRIGVADAVNLKGGLMRYLYLEHLETVTFERLCSAVGIVTQSPAR